MFDSVPSVEYKRLEEDKTGEQADSLEDLTVSLNEKQNIVPVTNDEKDIIIAKENLFQYIDEDPFTLAGMQSRPVETPLGQSNRDRRYLCDDCVDAGHLEDVLNNKANGALAFVRHQSEEKKSTGGNTEEEPEVERQVKQLTLDSLAIEHNITLKSSEDLEQDQISKKPIDISKNEILEPKESAQRKIMRKPLMKQRSEVGDREEGAKTNNQTSFHQTDQLDLTKPQTGSSDTGLEESCSVQETPVEKGREDPLSGISSKLSVTSSAESAASFSFSVDSLGWC